MMKKSSKAILLSLVFILVLTLLSGCGSKKDENIEGGEKLAGEIKTVKIFNFKVEIAEAFDRMKTTYEASHPGVKIQIETLGGGGDYGAGLKTKVAAGDIPDIFNNGGFGERETWMEYLEDLSDQPWVKDVIDVAKEPMTKDGKMYGMPMNLEGYGFIYNKDLFAKAGITELPKTITELEDAAKKLQAAGITPFSNGYQEWWVLGIHNVNVAFARQENPDAFIEGLNKGESKIVGNPIFNQWTQLLDLTLKYSNKNPLTTDYNTQVTSFASGQAAMMQQGNWTQVQIDQVNKDLNLGILPMPINDNPEENDKLFVGVPSNYVVYNKSPVKQEAKDFLNWMVSSDEGKKYIIEEFKFIPAFKSIEVKDPEILGDLATEVSKYSAEGKTYSWTWFNFPEGTTNEFGATIQAFIAKKKTKEEMFADFEKTWKNLKEK